MEKGPSAMEAQLGQGRTRQQRDKGQAMESDKASAGGPARHLCASGAVARKGSRHLQHRWERLDLMHSLQPCPCPNPVNEEEPLPPSFPWPEQHLLEWVPPGATVSAMEDRRSIQ